MVVEGRCQHIVDGGRHDCVEGQRARIKGRQPQLESPFFFFFFLPFLDMKKKVLVAAHKKRANRSHVAANKYVSLGT